MQLNFTLPFKTRKKLDAVAAGLKRPLAFCVREALDDWLAFRLSPGDRLRLIGAAKRLQRPAHIILAEAIEDWFESQVLNAPLLMAYREEDQP